MKWDVPPDLFSGTVAILGSGPSMTQELADSVMDIPCIAARRAVQFAPWAKIVVCLDAPSVNAEFWDETADFEGLRVCGAECEGLDALYLPMAHERVRLAEGHTVEFMNNGMTAIRIAAAGGASNILLLGFDTDGYGLTPLGTPGLGADGLTIALKALIAELRGRGIEVERVGDKVEA